MPFSAGVFSRVFNWATEQASPPIEISKLDGQETDFATGLSNCILRDGTGVPTAATPWNSQKITGLADAAAATDAMNRQASDARYVQTAAPYKTVTTSRSGTTTLADDPHLTTALAVGTWAVEAWMPVWATTAGTGGIKIAFAFSGTATSAAFSANAVTSGGAFTGATAGTGTTFVGQPLTVGTGITLVDWFRFTGIIIVTVTGTLSVQWAQQTSNGNATNMGIGAWLTARKLA